mgnify:CR=1 FL=1
MLPSAHKPMPQSPLYQKAMDIFRLSRSISHYFVDDLNYLQKDGHEHPDIYFTGDIVQQSVSLGPEILRAESEAFSDAKQRHAASVARLTNRLYKNCERLELSNSNGRDFLPLLRKELKKFRHLQRMWMLTL